MLFMTLSLDGPGKLSYNYFCSFVVVFVFLRTQNLIIDSKLLTGGRCIKLNNASAANLQMCLGHTCDRQVTNLHT